MQLVEAPRYKPEGCRFDPGLTKFFVSQYGLGVDSASDINEYQGYLLVQRRPVPRADDLHVQIV